MTTLQILLVIVLASPMVWSEQQDQTIKVLSEIKGITMFTSFNLKFTINVAEDILDVTTSVEFQDDEDRIKYVDDILGLSTTRIANGEGVCSSFLKIHPKGSIKISLTHASLKWTSDWLPVSNKINIALFRPTISQDLADSPDTSGDIYSKIENLLQHTVTQANEGFYGSHPFGSVVPGFEITLETFKYGELAKKDKRLMLKEYLRLRGSDKTYHAIIGPNNNEMANVLLPLANRDKYPVTSFQKDTAKQFTNKTPQKFGYFTRLALPEDVFLGNVFRYLKQQGWTSVVLFTTDNDEFSDVDWTTYSDQENIAVTRHSIKGSLDSSSTDADSSEKHSLRAEFNSVIGSGRKILLTTATGYTALNLFKEANKYNITSRHGFQWIGLKNQKDLAFLSKNSEDWCIQSVPCNENVSRTKISEVCYKLCVEEFKGTIVIDNMDFLQFNTTQAELAWRGYAVGDNVKIMVPPNVVSEEDFASIGVDVSLAYDALKLNIEAIKSLIYQGKILTANSIHKQITNSPGVVGLTGMVEFDNKGNRKSFPSVIHTLWPINVGSKWLGGPTNRSDHAQWNALAKDEWYPAVMFEDRLIDGQKQLVSSKIMSSDMIAVKKTEEDLIEHLSSKDAYAIYRLSTIEGFDGLHSCQIPLTYFTASYKKDLRQFRRISNKIGVYYCKGSELRQSIQMLAKEYESPGPWGSTFEYGSTDKIPLMTYTCVPAVESIDRVAPFYCEQGCGDNEESSAYSSPISAKDVSKYANGVCIKQNVCRCKKGWSGKDCTIPICRSGCVEGECVGPDTCRCRDDYEGARCDIPKCPLGNIKCGRTIFNCTRGYCSRYAGSCRYGEDGTCVVGGKCSAHWNCQCDKDHWNPNNDNLCTAKATCILANAEAVDVNRGLCLRCNHGFYGDNCGSNYYSVIGVTIIWLAVAAGIVVFALRWYLRKKEREDMLASDDWVVQWDDVKIEDKSASAKSSMMISAISMNAKGQGNRQQFNIGTWDGIDVYYQKLEKDTVLITTGIREEVTAMRQLKHPNLCILIGCSLVFPNVAILNELVPKGSIEDIFSNEEIQVPWSFKFGMLKGVCSGMEFILQSDVRCHGRLKSSNCLVDNRWTVKLSGFGLKRFKSKTRSSEMENYNSLLWTAPELIREHELSNLDHLPAATPSNDVYAFGVLISEFCTRELPFSDVMIEKSDLIKLIAQMGDSTAAREIWDQFLMEHNLEKGSIVRPVITDEQWPRKYELRKRLKTLMENCWSDDASQRPSMANCHQAIKELDPNKGELIDTLVNTLESYSTNLEGIVAKRTKQLEKERKRAEDLVSRLLPKSVAEVLKQGMTVSPENFDCVSIYFSDIVGFTSIAKESTPMQVVALLNGMYTSFDNITAKRDVYKVETIGDAYMIVSGVPIRNTPMHAGEICLAALELMSAIDKVEVPHLQGLKLKLRAGVHTGNVVAGVVGIKMPRYCLFGDDCAIASEMESGGIAERIQISEKTVDVLKELGTGSFYYEFRHEIKNTKYGTLKTYLLTGAAGFKQSLPWVAEV